MVYCLSRSQPPFSSRRRKRATGPIGPSSLIEIGGQRGNRPPPQPKAADLQIDARARRSAAENSRFSEQTRKPVLEKVRGVRRPKKSGSEERPSPTLCGDCLAHPLGIYGCRLSTSLTWR